ncbi:hypothetical protein QMU91_001132 [Flavobacterium psychrophilum]|nr:hypothetical protein [Flavobacterium psychrophilum]ELY1979232.1 hypothetical protein [Flavobacterium psychrophilum]
MKSIKNIVVCLLVLIALASCGSSKPIVVQNETTKTITETVHDTVFKIEKDSSSLKALLECQGGKIVLKNVIQGEPGRILKSPKIRLLNNVVQVDCEARAQELLAHYKATHEVVTTVKMLPPIEVNVLTFLQQLQIWLGRIFIGFLFYWTTKLILKIYKPI